MCVQSIPKSGSLIKLVIIKMGPLYDKKCISKKVRFELSLQWSKGICNYVCHLLHKQTQFLHMCFLLVSWHNFKNAPHFLIQFATFIFVYLQEFDFWIVNSCSPSKKVDVFIHKKNSVLKRVFRCVVLLRPTSSFSCSPRRLLLRPDKDGDINLMVLTPKCKIRFSSFTVKLTQ